MPHFEFLEREKDLLFPFRAGPAIHVCYVLIYTPATGLPESHVYGEITITDYLKNKFYIYNRSEDDPDLLGHSWYEIGLTRCPIAPVMGGYVRFQLTNKPIHNSNDAHVCIFDADYDMNKARKRDDGSFVLVCEGNLGYRFGMVFTKIPFAVIAKVLDMFVESSKPNPGEDQVYSLQGKIITNNIICIQIEPQDTEIVNRGEETNFPLYRNVYAVPVDSALAIDLDFYNGSTLISKKRYRVKACQGTNMPVPRTHLENCEAHGYAFGIQVEWMIHEDFFAYDTQIISSPTYPPFCKNYGPCVSGALVEVFSVVFYGGNSSVPCDIDLHGTILVTDGAGEFNILAGNKDCPDYKLLRTDEHQFRSLSLEWPNDRWVVGEEFDMNLELKDAANNPVCKALISWFPDRSSRYDLRLCDTFKCVKGYLAAVNYSVFKNGKKAKVSIECSNGTYSIYGNIFAKYKNQEYFSTYDEQCFQSILFKRSEEDPMVVTGQIRLLKTQVSAPSDCNELGVRGDLWVRPSSETCPHELFHLDTTAEESCNIGWGGSLTVKVEWV